MKKQPLIYRVNIIGMALGIFALLRIVIPNICRSIGMYANDYTSVLAYAVTLGASSFIPVVFIEKMCESYPILFKKQKFDLNRVSVVIFGFFTILFANFISGLLFLPLRKFGIVFPAGSIALKSGAPAMFLYYISITVLPAFFEEIFLRGVVLNRLLPYGRNFAIIFSSFMFMLMHTKRNGYPAFFAAGVILACVYLYTDNIFLSMALHFINNSYSFLMMYIQQYIGGISSVGAMVFIIMTVILTGVWRCMHLYKQNINIFSVMKKQGKEKGRLSVIFKSPVMLLSVFICLLTMFNQLFNDLNL